MPRVKDASATQRARRAVGTGAPKSARTNGGDLGFEAKLWSAADKLRGHMDAAEYKHVVLGLIFLKYISDAFEELHAQLAARSRARPRRPRRVQGRERLLGAARRRAGRSSQASAKQPTIGKIVDDAMVAIEHDNPRLKGVLPKDYARPSLDKTRLGELIDLVEHHRPRRRARAAQARRARPRLRILPRPVRQRRRQGRRRVLHAALRGPLLVEMIEPYKGRVFDPCCGSGGMFVQSEKFVARPRRPDRRHLASTARSRTTPPGAWR